MTPLASCAPRGGRVVSWVGFIFGSVISTAGNVLYTWIPPDHAAPGWQPTITAQVFAAVWPLALLLAVEVLSRVRWPAGMRWAAARYGGAGTVALGSAVISYGHLNGVLTAWSYGPLGAGVGPLVLDGLMVVSGFALLAPDAGQTGQMTDATGHVPAVMTGPMTDVGPGRLPADVPGHARADQPRHQAAVLDDVPDETVLAWLTEQTGKAGKVPGRAAVMKEFGLGSSRADRLRAQVPGPGRMRAVR